MTVRIDTPRFFLRELTEEDATERYLAWLHDPVTRRYVATAAATRELSGLRQYIRERVGRPDVLFLGIFSRDGGLHVGNVKYEPVDEQNGYAVMGILVGEPAFRGQGVAQEVLAETGRWLKANRAITELVLGVERANTAAIRAYERVGYRESSTSRIPDPKPGSVTMVWRI